jgi:predicted nucleotidyltransferase
MRLTDFERRTIVDAVSSLDPDAEVWLFGSRANDAARGGDIDLLVISSKIGFSEKLDLLGEIKMILGDQKIDLNIVGSDRKTTDALAAAVLPTALRL